MAGQIKLELYVWVSGHPVTLPIEISRHFLYIYHCNHGINVYMVDRFIVYVFYIRVFYVRFYMFR